MTNKEKKDWLAAKFPLTVIRDRYEGTYSGAVWLAFPLHYFYIPSGIRADDPACANFWKDYKEPVGKGAYANDAVKDLIEQMREFEPEESEDERVRKWIYTIVEFLGCPSDDEAARELEEMQPLALAWLEKQQNKARLITANLLEDGIIGVQRELIEFLANNIDAAWVEVIKSADAYAQRIRSMVEKQKEKPAEYLDKNKVYAIMTKLTNLSYSQLIPINSDEYKKIDEITGDVRRLLDYPIEQKPADEQDYSGLSDLERAIHRGFLSAGVENVPVTVIKETAQECLAQIKPAEWSEEDEKMMDSIINELGQHYKSCTSRDCPSASFSFKAYQKEIDWLKSLSLNLKKKNEDVAKLCSNEWSEEDERVIRDACCWIAEYAGFLMSENKDKAEMLWKLSGKLQSLRPQYHGDVTMTEAYIMGLEAGKASSWKPSEHQLSMLKAVIRNPNNAGAESCHLALESLLEDLTKL